ncbi:MAG: hypothetical protein F6K19_12805 [Cyanothece sp. SIO1E1]|nr:hypothetical protein [Cyanothece sp. SIO1E1]
MSQKFREQIRRFCSLKSGLAINVLALSVDDLRTGQRDRFGLASSPRWRSWRPDVAWVSVEWSDTIAPLTDPEVVTLRSMARDKLTERAIALFEVGWKNQQIAA